MIFFFLFSFLNLLEYHVYAFDSPINYTNDILPKPMLGMLFILVIYFSYFCYF